MKYNRLYPLVLWGMKEEDMAGDHGIDFKKREKEIVTYTPNNLAYNPSSVLFKERIITFYEPVFPDSANDLKEKLLVLDKMPKDGEEYQDITLYIDSPGGDLISLFGIYDTMQHIKSEINTMCVGCAASAASIILTAGASGKRYALPNSTIMIHQLRGKTSGTRSDMKIFNDFSDKLTDRLLDIYVRHARYDETGEYVLGYGDENALLSLEVEAVKPTKKTPKEAKEWLDKWLMFDRWLSAEQAQALGLIDHIIPIKDINKKK